MTETDNQKRRIFDYMLDGNTITPREASKLFDCDRLPARIYDLRHDGVPIESKFEYKYNDKGRIVKKWKKYWIELGKQA